MSALDNAYNIFDLREAAKRRLPKAVFEFVDRATEDQLREIIDAYNTLKASGLA